MIKIAICDDYDKDREKLQRFLGKYMQESGRKYTLQVFESGEQFLDSRFIPDILFLDIIMSVKNGIEVGDELRRINTDVLIIYSTHATGQILTTFNYIHPFGYLVKPIVERDVVRMVADAIRYMDNRLDMDMSRGSVTFLSMDNVIINLYVMDIYYFEYKNRMVKIVAKDSSYICKEKINDVAKKMEKFGFAMSHQSFVVNLYHIEKISGSMIFMKNGAQVYLAQKRAAPFRKQLMLTVRKSINNGGSKNKLTY